MGVVGNLSKRKVKWKRLAHDGNAKGFAKLFAEG